MTVTVEEYTSPNVITVDASASIADAHEMMNENGIRHLPVIENKKLVGVVSIRDTTTHLGKSWEMGLRVSDIMNTELVTVHKNEELGEVAFMLSTQKVGSAIVLDDDQSLFGIFTTTDALNALVEIYEPKAREKSDLKSLNAF